MNETKFNPQQDLEKKELSPKELLHGLEREGKYFFHGSPVLFKKLKPQQSHKKNEETNKMEKHGKSAVCVTPFADIAIFRSVINKTLPIHDFKSGFGMTEKVENGERKKDIHFEVSEDVKQFIESHYEQAHGFVYVIKRDGFEEFSPMEWRADHVVYPEKVIEVSAEDIPKFDVL